MVASAWCWRSERGPALFHSGVGLLRLSHPCLVCVLFSAPSLLEMKFFRKLSPPLLTYNLSPGHQGYISQCLCIYRVCRCSYIHASEGYVSNESDENLGPQFRVLCSSRSSMLCATLHCDGMFSLQTGSTCVNGAYMCVCVQFCQCNFQCLYTVSCRICLCKLYK